MNTINSTYSPQALQTTQGVKKANQQANVKPVDAFSEENKESKTAKDKTRFDVSENAIALLQEQEQSTSSFFSGTQSNNQSSTSGQPQSNSQYDQPSKQNLSAVAAYESVDNIAQRENIKKSFGVNLFA